MGDTVSEVKKMLRSKRAGLILPVSKIHMILKTGQFAPRIGDQTAVFLAAAIQYLALEIMELSVGVMEKLNKKRIKPRHILLAIQTDDELNGMLRAVQISGGGVPIVNDQYPKTTGQKLVEDNKELSKEVEQSESESDISEIEIGNGVESQEY